MNSLDLHGVDHDKVELEIERFIARNFSLFPVKVITGHSRFNIDKLKDIVSKYRLEVYMENWTNRGAYIVRFGELE